MPVGYSVDLRVRVIHLYGTGSYTRDEVADLLDISLSAVKTYLRLDRLGKDLNPGQSSGRIPKISPEEHDYIKELVNRNPDAQLVWFCEEISRIMKITISQSTMCRLLIKLGFTRKKKSLRTGAGSR